MSEANKRTIEAYDNGVQGYIDTTPQETYGSQKEWLDKVFEGIAQDAAVLEIGSASGRDAFYLQQKGYKIDVTDATPSFVNYLREHGYNAAELNIIEDVPQSRYDVVLSLAVFLHFTDDDFIKAINHVYECLNDGGKFIFTLKRGEGESWGNTKVGAERYYNYRERGDVENILNAIGLVVVNELSFEDDGWLYITAQKQE